MSNTEIERTLESKGVRPTANRILIIKALVAAGRPMSLSELDSSMVTVDKSSIFRALTTFREHRLLHVIDNGCDGVRYELCMCHDHDTDSDIHVHFYCEQCRRTFCIDNVPVPPVPLPDGYRPTTANYMVKGVCPECVDKR